MKKRLLTIMTVYLMVFSCVTLLNDSYKVYAADDYPYANACSGCHEDDVSPYQFYYRQCTDFVAWRLNHNNGVSFTNNFGGVRWGNANNWKNAAQSIGITVDSNPAVGAVAWSGSGEYGHVAWVASVSENNVVIEEYNYISPVYNSRTVSKSSFQYIHIKDISNSFVSYLDFPVAGGTYSGTVNIQGWALHKNGIDHVTAWVNGNAMACAQYGDSTVANAYPGYPKGKERFKATIPNSYLKAGSNTLDIYAYEKDDTPHLVASHSFNYTPDKVAPKITNVRIQNVTDSSYTVTFNVWDNEKTAKVRYETWTPDVNGFDDKVVKEVVPGKAVNGVVSMSYTVNTSQHNNEKGRYATHIYAYDEWGNSDNKLTNASIGDNYYTPKAITTSNGKTYELYDTTYWNWTTAKTYCDSIGGYLVCINSAEEQAIINKLLQSGTRDGYWIGSSDQYVEGDWGWVTAEAMNYKNWQKGQPDNFNSEEHYGMLWKSSGEWNDSPEDVRNSDGKGVYGFICERKAKPVCTDHRWDAGSVTKSATCTEAGAKTFTCSECGTKKTESIPALGHKWGAWSTIKEPTAAVAGTEEHHCTVCGSAERREIPKKTDSGSSGESGGNGSESAANPVSQMGADGTPLGKGASVVAAEAAIAGMTNDNDLPGSAFGKLQLRSKKQTKTSVTLSWKKIPGATSYVIYGNKCGKANKMKKLVTVTGKSKKFTKVLGRKVKKGTYYKFMIIALDKNNNVVSSSKIVHVATKGGKVGNVGKVTTRAKENKVSIKGGKTFKLLGKQKSAVKKLRVKKHRPVTYESSNSRIATVSKKGVIRGKTRGTCYIYAYAQNGVFAKIKVTVK